MGADQTNIVYSAKTKLYRETTLIDHYMVANYIVYKSFIFPLLTQQRNEVNIVYSAKTNYMGAVQKKCMRQSTH